MYLGSYEFAGDAGELLAAYDRLVASFPPGVVQLNLCIAAEHGVTVFDACPSRADFDGFSSSAEFRGALAQAGLPDPKVQPLGEVHHVITTA